MVQIRDLTEPSAGDMGDTFFMIYAGQALLVVRDDQGEAWRGTVVVQQRVVVAAVDPWILGSDAGPGTSLRRSECWRLYRRCAG